MSKYRFVVILAKTVLFVSGTNYLPITEEMTVRQRQIWDLLAGVTPFGRL